MTSIAWPRVVLYGDSITQQSFGSNGWGAVISNKLVRKSDVVNRGFSGYNTRWAKIVLPRIIRTESDPIAAVTVFFGANDSALEDKNPHQHVPMQEYTENLRAMVTQLASVGVAKDKVIFITPPPLHEVTWEKECCQKGVALDRLNSVAGQYAQACVQTGAACGVEVLDLWTLMQKDGQDFAVYLSDGLHLSEKGNQFVAEQLWRLLEPRVEALPFILPPWSEVNASSPETSLLN